MSRTAISTTGVTWRETSLRFTTCADDSATHIRITEVYETTFGDIPEKLWRAEVCPSAEDFRRSHRVS